MHLLFRHNNYFVKEHVGMFKASNNYDVYDPATSQMILTCREPKLGFFTKFFRFTEYKRMTPFEVVISQPNGNPLVTVKRDFTFFRSVVYIFDESNKLQGTFRQRMLSLGGKFDILDENNQVQCTLQGKWSSWDFTFVRNEEIIARVSKKWAGMGKELFTSADNYMLAIEPAVDEQDDVRILIIAAVMCIDMVLKE